MTVCPKCGENVPLPFNRLLIPGTKALGQEKPSSFLLLYECPKCHKRFISQALAKTSPSPVLQAASDALLTANVKNVVDRLTRIRGMLMATLKDLGEKIKALEEERGRLLTEVEGLRKAAEARVAVLEGEVGDLKNEAKALHELLGSTTSPAAPTAQISPPSK